MKILVKDGNWLADEVASALDTAGHEITRLEFDLDSELGHDESTDDVVAGHDAIVVFGYHEDAEHVPIIDRQTRQLYNLLHAAWEAGVGRCVYVSSLRLFADYEENLTVTEKWRSLPPTEDVLLLACHLGEIVCKEFARDRRIQVATLRLGFPTVPGNRAAVTGTDESAAICGDDAVEAITRALGAASLAQWQDIHVQSPVEHQRYLMHAATELLGWPW